MRKKHFRKLLLIFLLLVSVVGSASACEKNDGKTENNDGNNNMASRKITVKIGSRTFTATLSDNDPARAFKEMLPLTVDMNELNGNEKYFDLPQALPTSPSNPGTIRNGDLMLFGSRTLVLFYKSSSTSYSYTRLGRVNDAAGLASALGSGNVTVTFDSEQK